MTSNLAGKVILEHSKMNRQNNLKTDLKKQTLEDSINNAGEYLIEIGNEIFSFLTKKP